MRVIWISIHSWFLYVYSISILNILNGSLKPKLKGASVWSFNARGKVARGLVYHIWSLYRYCKEKIDQTLPVVLNTTKDRKGPQKRRKRTAKELRNTATYAVGPVLAHLRLKCCIIRNSTIFCSATNFCQSSWRPSRGDSRDWRQ